MTDLKKLYTLQEASEHTTREDCWVIVDGKVYDVTSFLNEHPGGDDVLINATGRDSKEDFEFANHSKEARELMQSYCVGELDPSSLPQKISTTKHDLTHSNKNGTFKYWAISAAIIGISVFAGILYLPK